MSAADVDHGLQTLLTPNSSAFEDFLAELLNPDNERRSLAEQVLEKLKKHPDLLIQYLISTLRSSNNEAHRIFAAVLLRKSLTLDSTVLWPQLTDHVKHMVKVQLLESLTVEKSQNVAQKTCDVISELASFLLCDSGWPELTPTLFQLLQSNVDDLMLAGLHITGSLALKEELDLFKESIPALVGSFDGALSKRSKKIKSEAVSAVCSVVSALSETKLRNQFQPLLPKIMSCLGQFLYEKDFDPAEQVLENLIDVAEDAPRFLKKALPEILPVVLEIASSVDLVDDVRILAAEFMVTLAEKKDKGLGNLSKLVPSFSNKVFEVLMFFLLDIEDIPEWHKAVEEDEEDLGNGELFEFSHEAFDRLAIAIGGKVLVPIAGPVLTEWTSDQDWKKRHAALICLSQIAEGCADVMLKEIDILTQMCITGLADNVAKVRWAACHALGQMCTDLGPELQEANHQNIVPGIINTMMDHENPRVQAHAAAAIVNFSEDCEKEDVEPYLDSLVSSCVTLMHSSSRLVSESAVTALASIADSVNSQFEKYYVEVMPMLRTILTQASDRQYQTLRAKALECISLVGMAVGKDTFRQDANEVMQIISQLHQSHFEPSDPLPSYMIQAGARMCRCLGPEFIPYLNLVLPHVIKIAAAEPDIQVSHVDDDLKAESESDDDLETIVLGGKILKLRTSAMEEKANACEMLVSYANSLKEGFLPYLKDVTDIMVPLTKFYFNEEVRNAAFEILPELLECVLEGLRRNHGISQDFFEQMVQFIWKTAFEALDKEPDMDVQETGLKSIALIIDLLSSEILTQDMVESCFSTLKKTFEENEKRRKERIEYFADGEEEDLEEFEKGQLPNDDEEEEEMLVLEAVTTVLSSLMKNFGDNVMQYIISLMPFVQNLLEESRSPVEQRTAICVLDDILEYCPQGGNKHVHEFLPILMLGASSEDANIRQVSIYGLGVIVEKYPQAFQPLIPKLLPELVNVVQHALAKSKENEVATDNAVSTIGKIMRQFPDQVNPEIVENVWFKNLPLLHDEQEGHIMHGLLINMVEHQDVRIFKMNNENLPAVIEKLVQVLAAGKSQSNVETGRRICEVLQSFGNSLGDEVIRASVEKMTPKQQKIFHEYSSSLRSNVT